EWYRPAARFTSNDLGIDNSEIGCRDGDGNGNGNGNEVRRPARALASWVLIYRNGFEWRVRQQILVDAAVEWPQASQAVGALPGKLETHVRSARTRIRFHPGVELRLISCRQAAPVSLHEPCG